MKGTSSEDKRQSAEPLLPTEHRGLGIGMDVLVQLSPGAGDPEVRHRPLQRDERGLWPTRNAWCQWGVMAPGLERHQQILHMK